MELVLYNLCLIACIGTVVAFLFNRLQPSSRVWTISISVTVLLFVLVSVNAWLGWNAAEKKLDRSLTLALVVLVFGTILGRNMV